MSGFLKNVVKVFKKVISSPIFKVVAIAAAVYFTGGLALTAVGGEAAAFAAGFPGISSAASALGIGEVAGGALANVGIDAAALADGTMFGTSLAESGGATLLTTAADGTLMSAADVAGGFAGPEGLMDAAANPDYFSIGANSGQTAIDAAPTDTLAGSNNAISGGVNTGPVSGAPDVGLSPNSPVTGSAGSTGSTFGTGFTNTVADEAAFSQISQSLVPPGASPTVMGNLKSWYGNLSPLEKKILGEGVTQLGKGALSQLSVQSQQNFQQALINQQRADKARLGQVPNITGAFSYTKGPGLINSVSQQGPIKVGG